MATLQIDELDLSPSLQIVIRQIAAEEGQRQAQEFIDGYKEKNELPRFMNKKQTCKYMHTSFVTLTRKYIPMGLRVILIDGEEKIDQRDCDAFYEKHKK